MVSILVLTYNHEKYIKQTLESILCQKTSFVFEIVIGEDKSTDGTLAICEEFEKKYPDKIRILRRPSNLGEIRNFANTFEECQNKYIAFCEGDDFWINENKIQNQIEFLEQNPDFVMHFTECRYANSKGELLGFFGDGRGIENKKNSEISTKDVLEAPLRPIHISGLLMRRSKVSLPPSYLQTPILDTPFLFYNTTKGKVFYSGMVTAAYRKHEDSITTKNPFSKTYLHNLKRMFKRLDKELEFQFSRSIHIAIANRYVLARKTNPIYKEKIKISFVLLYYMLSSGQYTFRDWLWITFKFRNT